jgi:hypothetical protein
VAKQLDTLSSDERGELKVLTDKPDKHESTMADLLRECQHFEKAGLLSDAANIELDKVSSPRVRESDFDSATAALIRALSTD